jgi:nitroreductase
MRDPVQDEEDLLSTGVAAYIVLLAAHARGLVGYWRTPGILRSERGRAAVGIPDDERFVALLHLGHPRQEKEAPEREPAGHYVTYLP